MRVDRSQPKAAWWVLAVLALGACNTGRSKSEAGPPSAPAAEAPARMKAEELRVLAQVQQASVGSATAAPGAAPGALEALAASRKLIRSGKVGLEVPAYDAAAAAVARIAESEGGY